MHQFAGQEPDDKLRFLFKIYDVDGDGSIQCEELGKVMRACMEENGMKFSDVQIRTKSQENHPVYHYFPYNSKPT
jgi:Ca2+-binding EF-hand superfamily protein